MEHFFEDHYHDAFGCMVEAMGEDFNVKAAPTVSFVPFAHKSLCHMHLVVFMYVLFLFPPPHQTFKEHCWQTQEETYLSEIKEVSGPHQLESECLWKWTNHLTSCDCWASFFFISTNSLVSSANSPIMWDVCSAHTATSFQTWCTASPPTCWLPSSTRSCRSRETAGCSSKVPQVALWPSCPSATLVLGAAASSTQEAKARTVSVSFCLLSFSYHTWSLGGLIQYFGHRTSFPS